MRVLMRINRSFGAVAEEAHNSVIAIE
jgi:hypothetical protein